MEYVTLTKKDRTGPSMGIACPECGTPVRAIFTPTSHIDASVYVGPHTTNYIINDDTLPSFYECGMCCWNHPVDLTRIVREGDCSTVEYIDASWPMSDLTAKVVIQWICFGEYANRAKHHRVPMDTLTDLSDNLRALDGTFLGFGNGWSWYSDKVPT
jgi:hypothetical protein